MEHHANDRSPRRPVEPTFLGLGVLKAGTTLLHSWLADHPQVCVPRDRKEVDYFTEHYDRGQAWYRSLFAPTMGQVIGEYSITYIESPEALDRIARELPGVKCIVSLRDPVYRLDSQYRHWAMRTGYRGSRRDFIAEHPNAINSSLYAAKLERLRRLFPAEQILVLLFEDITSNPAGAARQMFQFIGVDPAVEVDTDRRANVTRGVQWRAAAAVRERVRGYALDRDQRWLLQFGRMLRLGKMTVTSRHERGIPSRIKPDEAAELRPLFVEDTERAAQLLDRDLLSIWLSYGA